MTDHIYEMSALNQNIGYNQPNHLGYYLGSDLTSDEEAWEAAGFATSVEEISESPVLPSDDCYYDLTGRKVTNPGKGIYIRSGKKIVM